MNKLVFLCHESELWLFFAQRCCLMTWTPESSGVWILLLVTSFHFIVAGAEFSGLGLLVVDQGSSFSNDGAALMNIDSTCCHEWDWLSELNPGLLNGRLKFESQFRQLVTPNCNSNSTSDSSGVPDVCPDRGGGFKSDRLLIDGDCDQTKEIEDGSEDCVVYRLVPKTGICFCSNMHFSHTAVPKQRLERVRRKGVLQGPGSLLCTNSTVCAQESVEPRMFGSSSALRGWTWTKHKYLLQILSIKSSRLCR